MQRSVSLHRVTGHSRNYNNSSTEMHCKFVYKLLATDERSFYTKVLIVIVIDLKR